eukprot:CAMPEP_0179104238 /NCGR_PEP_ID=MMETSP0796-20121207/48342_1 /TAXON_ID=73915 /ORGANISM="Pyrodinium bahamense, Strain pbaha01" /LENGTH=51 /DNA_ID=CAMNT_0020802173 /DNA_START=89 /DNA_END=244 /DNA_ORIENTATION=-
MPGATCTALDALDGRPLGAVPLKTAARRPRPRAPVDERVFPSSAMPISTPH